MDMQSTTWGYDPSNTPLGSEGSPSMPEASNLGLGDPIAAEKARFRKFTKQVQRTYGEASDVKGAMWDPRGHLALSSEVADYRKGNQRPYAPSYKPQDELGLGAPVIPVQNTGVNKDAAPYYLALSDPGSGLSPKTAARLSKTLAMQKQSTVEGMYLPRQVEPTVSTEYGFVTRDGNLPRAFMNESTKRLHVGMADRLSGLERSNKPPQQHVDENGVVHKYAPGTGPYDSPSITRPSVPGTVPTLKKTPAQLQADTAYALRAAGGDANGVTINQNIQSGGSSTGAPVGYDEDGNVIVGPSASGQPQANRTSTSAASTSVSAAEQPVQFNDKPKSKFPWLILAGIGGAAVGIGMLVRTND